MSEPRAGHEDALCVFGSEHLRCGGGWWLLMEEEEDVLSGLWSRMVGMWICKYQSILTWVNVNRACHPEESFTCDLLSCHTRYIHSTGWVGDVCLEGRESL